MKINIPGRGELTIDTIILDLNGTLAIGGKLVDGAEEKLRKLKRNGFRLVLFSGDTRGNAAEIANRIGLELIKTQGAKDKEVETIKLNPQTCASIGNGLIDKLMMRRVQLAILTLQAEGIHVQTMIEADIVVPNINDALDLFIDTNRLIATLRR